MNKKVFFMYLNQYKDNDDFTSRVNLIRLMEIQLGEKELGYAPKNEVFQRRDKSEI